MSSRKSSEHSRQDSRSSTSSLLSFVSFFSSVHQLVACSSSSVSKTVHPSLFLLCISYGISLADLHHCASTELISSSLLLRLDSASQPRVSPLFSTHGDPCIDHVGNEFLISFEKPRSINDPLYSQSGATRTIESDFSSGMEEKFFSEEAVE